MPIWLQRPARNRPKAPPIAKTATPWHFSTASTIFSSAKSDDNNERSDSARVILDGTVKAGIHSQQLFNISEAGVITRGDSSNNQLVQVSGALLNSAYITAEANNIYYALGTAYP
ncbi:MAG TPA: hypothetical protein VFO15_07875, partial [Xanthobacteraceae bacterium]|nr:hypothetical protein [Xanthobacteraceae bacterium]